MSFNLKININYLQNFNYYKYIVITILLVFLISANKAWLNPEPTTGAIKINKKIPILWQYIVDTKFDLLTSAYFFDYMKMEKPGNVNKFRINRPAIPALNFILSKPIHFIGNLFFNISKLESAAIAFLIVKFTFYLISSLFMFFLIKKLLNSKIAMIGVFLFLTHPFMIYHATHLSIPEFSFFIPIIIIYMFSNLAEKYTYKKNIIFSLILGFLMLAKQAYGIYLAIIIFSLIFKKYKQVILSFIIHLIPLIFYLILLNLNDIEYYNHEVVCCNAPTWIFNDLILRPITEVLHVGIFSFHIFLLKPIDFYHIWFLMCVVTTYLFFKGQIKNNSKFHSKKIVYFFILILFFSWVQFFAGNRWWVNYMASADFAVFVYGSAGFILNKILNIFSKKIKKKLIFISVPIIIILSMFRIVNFPYEHPYDQKEYLIKDPSLYDKFEN